MNKTLVLLASLLIATTPLAGCIDGDTLEEIIDDVVGCMDTEAKNYDENATTELVGNCIYAASKEAFMDAMNQEIDLQSMLNQSCLLYTSPSPRDRTRSRMPSSA